MSAAASPRVSLLRRVTFQADEPQDAPILTPYVRFLAVGMKVLTKLSGPDLP
jgi:hypothetical protein